MMDNTKNKLIIIKIMIVKHDDEDDDSNLSMTVRQSFRRKRRAGSVCAVEECHKHSCQGHCLRLQTVQRGCTHFDIARRHLQ